jgi:hypothetical protein
MAHGESAVATHVSSRVRWIAGIAAILPLLVAHRVVANLDARETSLLVPVAHLFDLGMLAFALVLSHAIGARTMRAMRLSVAPVEGMALATALGLGAVGYTALALGLIGLYRPPVLLGGVVVATFLLWREIADTVGGILSLGDRTWQVFRGLVRSSRGAALTLACLILASGLLTLNLPRSYGPVPNIAESLSEFLIRIDMPLVAGIVWNNTGLLTEWLYRLVLALATAAVAACGALIWRKGSDVRPSVVALVAVFGSMGFVTVYGALTPPHHWDPLTYHLAAPRYFLETGWIRPIPQIEWSNLPLTAELLYGIGLAFGSETFGQLLHLGFGGITAVALWGFARHRTDRPTAWMATAIFLATPQVQMWAHVANIDLALGCFIFLAIVASLHAGDAVVSDGGRWSESWLSESRRWLILAGVFSGFALGSKYQAVTAVVPLTLLILADSWWRQRSGADPIRRALVDTATFCATAALIASPWYIKNLVLLGNPVWPLLFGGDRFNAFDLELTNYYARSMVLSPRTLAGYLQLPIRAYEIGDYELTPGVVPSLLFPLAPLIVFVPRARRLWRELLFLLLVSAGFALGWALGYQELRYLLPLCAPLSFVVAILLRTAWDRPSLRPVVHLALLGPAIFTLLFIGFLIHWEGPPGVVLGRESRDAYLDRNASYRALRYLERQMQTGDEALFINDSQLFYFMPMIDSVRTDHLSLNLIRLMEDHPAPNDALAALQSEGVDYVLINEGSLRFWFRFDQSERLQRARERFDALIPYLDLVHREGVGDRTDVVVYRVPPAAGN